MGSPPRTRRFYRPLLEDIRRIAMDCKQRCAASVTLISRKCSDFSMHSSFEWTIESPVQHTVRLDYGNLSGRAILSVDGINAFERRPFESQETHEIEIDDARYTLVIRPEQFGLSCRLLRSGTPEAESERMASRRKFRRFAILLFAICPCFFVAAVTLPSKLAMTDSDAFLTVRVLVSLGVLYAAMGIHCVAVSFKRSESSRLLRIVHGVFEDRTRQMIAGSILLLFALSTCVVLGVLLFRRARHAAPAEMFLSVAGAVASISVAIVFGWIWFRLLRWWRRVPDGDVAVNTIDGARPRTPADRCRRLLEDIHRTAATR